MTKPRAEVLGRCSLLAMTTEMSKCHEQNTTGSEKEPVLVPLSYSGIIFETPALCHCNLVASYGTISTGIYLIFCLAEAARSPTVISLCRHEIW